MDDRKDKDALCDWEGNISVCHVGGGAEKVGLLGKKNKAVLRIQRGGEG